MDPAAVAHNKPLGVRVDTLLLVALLPHLK